VAEVQAKKKSNLNCKPTPYDTPVMPAYCYCALAATGVVCQLTQAWLSAVDYS
jgi:hypothetical protein